MHERENKQVNLFPQWPVISWALSGCCRWDKVLLVIPLIWIVLTLSLGHHQHRPQSRAPSEMSSFLHFFLFTMSCRNVSSIEVVMMIYIFEMTHFLADCSKLNLQCRTTAIFKDLGHFTWKRKSARGLSTHWYLQSCLLAPCNNIFQWVLFFYAFHSKPLENNRLVFQTWFFSSDGKKNETRIYSLETMKRDKMIIFTWFQLYDLHSSKFSGLYVSSLKDKTAKQSVRTQVSQNCWVLFL